jgi:hypothetical protein
MTAADPRAITLLNPAASTGAVDSSSIGNSNPAPQDVNFPDGVWFAQEPAWRIIAANLEGITHLRRYASVYLPKFPRERDDSYALRVRLSSYTPLLARLIRGAAGLILRKRIHLEGGDEAFWDEWRLNVDRCGTTLDDFAKMVVQVSLGYGHASILTDYPAVEARTLKEERDAAATPYLLMIPPWATIGRRQDPRVGFGKLQQVRIRETEEVPDGDYGLKLVERVRVLWPGRYELWERSTSTRGWQMITGGGLGLSEIPLATTYTGKTGCLTSRPPLLDCGELNITHFQRRTDLTMALVVAAQPILALMGFDDEDDSVALSVNNAIKLPIGGDGKYIEPSGASFDALQTELENLKNEITTLGISTLARQQDFQESGVAKGFDRAESNSMLAGVLHDLEKTLQQALGWVAEYAGVQPCTVHIDDDFDHVKLTPQEVTAYLAAVTAGTLDKGTVIDALIRGDWLPENTTVEDIIDAAEEEMVAQQERDMEKMAATAEVEVAKAKVMPKDTKSGAGSLPAARKP